ncbi:TBC1 domain protein [Fusarium subglutinans]|uniref:TBC1 domain protein n=1 Tax=Gibberella subglutinans TaxID=42677 RepID=A0A8H5UK58_GIBSU|nr:TBC1 domain protein [Fusarium subglutinans]KAF5592081.1 TBC1 domain protein [Fusarium subglutinans]
MRPLQESLVPLRSSRWRETQSQGAHLGDLRRAVRYNGPESPCISGCRSLCWKTFLLSTAAEGLSWAQVLDDERKLYAEKRDHFLKYIKHPEALAELNIDPLTEDPSSPWNTIRQDEIVRAEIQQDVQRLPDEASYHEDQTQSTILNILFMYCKLNPERGGYRQGMHELLAPILHVIEQDAVDPTTLPEEIPLHDALIKTLDHSFIEHDAFVLFSKLMERAQSFYEVKDVIPAPGSSLRTPKFAEQSSAIVERSKFIHEVCLQKVDPELATHLTNIEILPQIFLIRWIRLLFSREFPFEQFLVLWDTIFAVDPTLELIDLICVAMLIRIRWDLLEADYSVCLQLLLKYPPPPGAHGPHTFVDDALYLRDHLSQSGGSSLIMKYTGKMPTLSSPPQTSRAGTPSFRGFNSFKHRGPGPRPKISSPSRFLQQQGGMEALFQGAAKGAKGVYERGEKLGINQAVRDAMGEIKRNLNEARSAPRSPQPLVNNQESARSLAALERRNQQLAAMLDETVDNLKAISASNLDDKAKSLELIEIAAAKVQFVKIYLDDSSMEVPALQTPPPEDSPQEVAVAETAIVQPEPVSVASMEADISALQISESKESKESPESESARHPSSDRMDIVPHDDGKSANSLAPSRPAPVPTRSTLAQSSFSWMLEPDESGSSKASPASNKSPPPQHKKKMSNSASRGKNAFLFGEVTESRNPLNSDEIFGLEPLKKLKNATDEENTKEILNATSVQDLMYLMDIAIYGEEGRYPNASPAYCFLENKKTVAIEYSQHCGTLDMLETSLWARFCVKLTQHCLNKSGTFFYESYPHLRYCSTIHDFLKEQGLGELSKCFLPQSNHLKVPDLRYRHPVGRPDPHPNDGRELSRAEQFPSRVALMKEIISSKGSLTLVWDEYFDQKSWESKLLSHGMVPVDDIDPQCQTWTIGTDVSLHQISAWGGYKRLNGLEIVSPVLRNTPECWEEVLDMDSILRNNFRLTVGKSCGFHVHWSQMNVPADFKQYVPVDKVIDRRTLGILKKPWTAKTLQRLKLLITPSMGSKSCFDLSKCHSFDEFGEGSKDECKGTVEFRFLEGTLDPELIFRWSQLMVSRSQFADLASPQAWQNFVPAVLQCPALGKMDPNVLRVFLLFLGKGDDYDFWVNRIERTMNLPLDAQQLAHRPIDNNELLPPLDEGYIDALREELCIPER